jgi:hypothetical protein
MKTLVVALAAVASVALVRPAAGQMLTTLGPPPWYGNACMVPGYAFAYPASPYYPYYPYPLPPAPSLGFGRGGVYGHVFVGRDESIVGFTLPGGRRH